MHSLIIHLPSSTARRPNVERLLKDLPNAQVVEAVNGRDASQISKVRSENGTLHQPSYPFALTPAEIGVFQSHRRCWQMILDEGWDYAIIVEDDLAVTPEKFRRALDLLDPHLTTDMYVRLPPKIRETPAALLAEDGDMQLMLPSQIGLQCCCQVVGRDAAMRLLAGSEEIDRPVDTWLQMHWVTDQPIHALLPNGNAEIAGEIGGSTIQKKTRTSGKLMREINRAVYRAKIKRRPQTP